MPARGGRTRRGGSLPIGASRADGARPTRPSSRSTSQSLALTALRERAPHRGRCLPDRRPAPARHQARRRRSDVRRHSDACAGSEDGMAECEGRGRRERLNAMLLGDLAPGTWILAYQGSAVRAMSEDEAQQTNQALDALDAAMNGRDDIDLLLRRSRGPRAQPAAPPEGFQGMSALPLAGPAVHPLVEQLFTRHGFVHVNADSLDAFAAAPGHALLVFTEDPVRFKETLDLAVIAPEVARAFAGAFRTGVLLPRRRPQGRHALRLRALARAGAAEGRPVRRRHRRPAQLGGLRRGDAAPAGGRARARRPRSVSRSRPPAPPATVTEATNDDEILSDSGPDDRSRLARRRRGNAVSRPAARHANVRDAERARDRGPRFAHRRPRHAGAPAGDAGASGSRARRTPCSTCAACRRPRRRSPTRCSATARSASR